MHIRSVICILVPLAEPDIALRGIIIGLSGSDLELALDIAVGVRGLIVVNLLATCGFHGGTRETWLRRSEETVAGDRGDETCSR